MIEINSNLIVKSAIYISGIIGGLLLVLSFVAYMVELPVAHLLFYLAVVVLLVGFLPLYIFSKRRASRRIQKIIQKHAASKYGEESESKESVDIKSWGMNDSPYRERKSGLIWGGGNIHASNATRPTRKKFLG